MKLLSVAIPSYNSEEYLAKCIRSVLTGGDRVEIIVVDDGSTDSTYEVAKKYEEKFPHIIKVVHQENGGHGEAVNTGLANATGKFFKVVDSDDCLGKNALEAVLNFLEEVVDSEKELDMLITNFLYDKQGAKHKKVMRYNHAIPKDRFIGWDDIKFGKSQYLLMHSVIYNTEVLRKSGLKLPKHTFYVDNIYVFQPLPYVKTIYYMDVVLYKYYIGRDDQSVNEAVMIKRLDQQYKVTEIMMDVYNNSKIENKNLDNVMVHYFDMMMCVSSILSIREGSEKRLGDKKKLWDKLKKTNLSLYKKCRKSILGRTMNLKGKTGRRIAVISYKIANQIFGFN
ncbi:MAG: glycosyltransferase family 2 protein [Lachnospiraceae bacterium]|nr:glycosyltransferase family 2 protein [Lachnospiraceae bacterium]